MPGSHTHKIDIILFHYANMVFFFFFLLRLALMQLRLPLNSVHSKGWLWTSYLPASLLEVRRWRAGASMQALGSAVDQMPACCTYAKNNWATPPGPAV